MAVERVEDSKGIAKDLNRHGNKHNGRQKILYSRLNLSFKSVDIYFFIYIIESVSNFV